MAPACNAAHMDVSIAGILMLDGVTNGAVYALLALATVLVFAVTRVIFIPQGEFVAFGALTLALLQPARCRARSGCCWCWRRWPRVLDVVDARAPRPAARRAVLRGAAQHARRCRSSSSLVTLWAAPQKLPLLVQSAADAGASSRRSARWSTGWPTSAGRRDACWCC